MTAANVFISVFIGPVEDVLDFDKTEPYQQDIAAKASISLGRRSAFETLPSRRFRLDAVAEMDCQPP